MFSKFDVCGKGLNPQAVHAGLQTMHEHLRNCDSGNRPVFKIKFCKILMSPKGQLATNKKVQHFLILLSTQL